MPQVPAAFESDASSSTAIVTFELLRRKGDERLVRDPPDSTTASSSEPEELFDFDNMNRSRSSDGGFRTALLRMAMSHTHHFGSALPVLRTGKNLAGTDAKS
jgi:hypothetical protein